MCKRVGKCRKKSLEETSTHARTHEARAHASTCLYTSMHKSVSACHKKSLAETPHICAHTKLYECKHMPVYMHPMHEHTIANARSASANRLSASDSAIWHAASVCIAAKYGCAASTLRGPARRSAY